MKSLSLILRIVAIFAACAAAALFFVSKGKLAEQQTQLEQARKETQTIQAELETANSSIATISTQLASERKSLAETKEKFESSRSQVYTAKQEVSRTQQQLRQAKATISSLENQATQLRSDLVKTEETLAVSSKESELAQLNERIEELTKVNDSLKQDLLSAEALAQSNKSSSADANRRSEQVGSSGYQSTFKPSTTPAAQAASIGSQTSVAAISSRDGIIVLDDAQNIGLTVGAKVTLVQGLTALGKIQVTKVTEQLAVANILPGTRLKLAVGDSVKILF